MMRARISFRSVNSRASPGHDPDLHRHHILPLQILNLPSFQPMLLGLGHGRDRFDDFRTNGLLLPANDDAAIRHCLPLHRGPHHRYNALVIERVGQIERGWSRTQARSPVAALEEALERLALLQRALRRRLLDQKKRLRLNSRDPLGAGFDFAELDAMADLLWPATQSPHD